MKQPTVENTSRNVYNLVYRVEQTTVFFSVYFFFLRRLNFSSCSDVRRSVFEKMDPLYKGKTSAQERLHFVTFPVVFLQQLGRFRRYGGVR